MMNPEPGDPGRPQLRLVDDGKHNGSKRWMRIRDGIIDPKHCKRMGEAVWLYLYLHKEAIFASGTVKNYTHIGAAKALGVGCRTVERYMARLIGEGYVVLAKGQHDASVTITRYRDTTDVATLDESDPTDVATLKVSDTPHLATLDDEGDAQSRHICRPESPHLSAPIPIHDIHDSITFSNEKGAIAPLIAEGTKTALPQYKVFESYCAAIGAEVADMDGRKGRACKEAATALRALTRRYAAEQNAGADPAARALADLCAMIHWKARALKSGRRDVMALTVSMAYQDQAAWRKAGAPAAPGTAGEESTRPYVLPTRKPNPDPVMEEYYQEIKRGYDTDPAYDFMRRAFGQA